MSQIFEYLNSKKAQNELKDMEWVAFTDKYDDTNLCFKISNGFNIEVNGNLLPEYFPKKENIVDFYDLLALRIALCLNLQKGKTNEELKELLRGLESQKAADCVAVASNSEVMPDVSAESAEGGLVDNEPISA